MQHQLLRKAASFVALLTLASVVCFSLMVLYCAGRMACIAAGWAP